MAGSEGGRGSGPDARVVGEKDDEVRWRRGCGGGGHGGQKQRSQPEHHHRLAVFRGF